MLDGQKVLRKHVVITVNFKLYLLTWKL